MTEKIDGGVLKGIATRAGDETIGEYWSTNCLEVTDGVNEAGGSEHTAAKPIRLPDQSPAQAIAGPGKVKMHLSTRRDVPERRA